ncbi:MAG: hypothetical protein KDN05_13895 [Verrucomicrobiae bacterium]|nr:hypothetical protein [Verrucomicrobiae bacterium]MCP5532697.1 hypothetical protein [Akkermansiaceae bacterium]MCP5548684.1 hypothetical protein [Akkermansiaceae bacterium]
MHQITQLLFADFFSKGGLGRRDVVEAIEDAGLKVDNIGRFATFRYEDGALLHVQLGFHPDDRLNHASLSIGIEGDEKGWAGWSKDREMQRLAQQEEWMRERGIEKSNSGKLRISNTFSPQDGSSSITITTAEAAGGNGGQAR